MEGHLRRRGLNVHYHTAVRLEGDGSGLNGLTYLESRELFSKEKLVESSSFFNKARGRNIGEPLLCDTAEDILAESGVLDVMYTLFTLVPWN